jgi:hypothetical protein
MMKNRAAPMSPQSSNHLRAASNIVLRTVAHLKLAH